jgi:hypothetical protein
MNIMSDEPESLSRLESVFLPDADVWPMANLLVDIVGDAGNEPGVQYLPTEILSRII